MPSTTATIAAKFDALALTGLLNASFALWCVAATAEVDRGAALAARVHCENGGTLRVVRVDDDARGLPAWCYGPVDMPVVVAPRAASLVVLLNDLRMELDAQYAPLAPLIGAAQPQAS
jgi:hypothetical protein